MGLLPNPRRSKIGLFSTPEAYQLLFERNPLPMLIYDPKSLEILAVNDAAVALYGYGREEMFGLTMLDIRPAGERPRLLAALKDFSPGLRAWGAWRHQKKDGTVIDVDIVTSDFFINGRLVHYAQVREIGEQKRLEEQFRQAQKMEAVGRLAGGVAHDFNNLLSVINGYCDLLLMAPASPDPDAQAQRRKLEEIQKAGTRATTLTRQLLTLSRHQAEERGVVHLNDCVSGLASMLRRLIGEDMQLILSLDPQTGSIEADRSQLEQVLMNLAVNARDAMPNGGKLIFETRPVSAVAPCSLGGIPHHHADPERLLQQLPQQCLAHLRPDQGATSVAPEAPPAMPCGLPPGDYVQLTVSDTGCGMDEETRARIFEPFFSTKGNKGTGLGLSTVYGIVHQHSGTITVQSELGHGASFIICLPRGNVASAAAAPSA